MIMDISDWKIDETVIASGTREKFWLINPDNNKRYLFKLPKEGTGEIWAEKVASEVGKMLKLETMDVTIAQYKGRNGLLLTNFINYGEEEFFDGGDLLKVVLEEFDPNNLQGYNIENIMTCLKQYNLEFQMVRVIMFDALIANQDRHCENWGVILKDGKVRFSPIFDNGASLGYNNSEERLNLMFGNTKMFEAFTNKGKSIIGLSDKKKPKIKLFLPHLQQMYPQIIDEEIMRLNYLQEDGIKHILEGIPFDIMSKTEKKWVEKILLYRKSWIISCLKES
ncbi:HipA domain-containing protein [Peribacillus frigoritolerans]|uniref:HipA domain-containing protein n=1 Tax=Peribacillus frigoritolerans TaxID=450367 RepID=UPI0025A198FE|nr:HipA domain-containing protein [Peribacillus frigoritolerans]MDM5309696.1 HipA domain-containing protein [Peribacillus frigoritolerans]